MTVTNGLFVGFGFLIDGPDLLMISLSQWKFPEMTRNASKLCNIRSPRILLLLPLAQGQ